MKKIIPLFIFLNLFSAIFTEAHQHNGDHYNYGYSNKTSSNAVQIKEDNEYRYIISNGIPNHTTGDFPNRNNPNSISAQDHHFRIPLFPQKTGTFKPQEGIVGVALNGIPFEPGTAEAFGKPRGQRGAPNQYKWREEAIVEGSGKLGLDQNNAHVQPTGTYHYHGIPYGFLETLNATDLVHIGYAADGFKIIASRSNAYKPSYQLKQGTRPDGPGGRYDGTYTADFEYIAGSGDLDQANGMMLNGEYVYFATEEFPFLPRYLAGEADPSFDKFRGGPPEGMQPHGPEGKTSE